MALFGDRIHVLAEDADRGRTAVEAALQAGGFSVLGLQVIEPTLEDIFTSAIPEAVHD